MAKKKNKKSNRGKWIVAGAILLIALALVGVFSQGRFSFSVAGDGLDLQSDVVFVPQFTNVQCGVIAPDYTETYDWQDREDSNGWIKEYCSRNDHEVYTNRCEIELTTNEQGTFDFNAYLTDLYICPVGTAFEDRDDDCQEITNPSFSTLGTLSYDSDEFILARAGDGFFGFGGVEDGEVTIKKVANWYGLITVDSNNYLSQEETCDIGAIKQQGFTFLESDADAKAPSGVLGFNQYMNYISAVQPAISKNVIQYNGQVVWTIGNGVVYPLKTDSEGIRFVDTRSPINAPSILCNPALPYCSDDGTEIINIDSSGGTDGGKTCNDLYGGFLDQFIPNPDDLDEVCKLSCGSDGNLKATSCKQIPTCDQGILNDEYVCVTAQVPQDQDDSLFGSGFVMIIIGIILLLILLMIAVKLRQTNGGKR